MSDREKVIEGLKKVWDAFDHMGHELYADYVYDALELLKKMEGMQELVRCQDCEHFKHWYKDKGRCFLWYETGIDVFGDGYCNYGKRKVGEGDEKK